MIEFIATLITLGIGFIVGAYTFHTPNKWSKWEDINIVYEDYTYSLLQVRTSSKGDRQFRKINIIRYASLPEQDKEGIKTIIDRLNKSLIKQ